MTNEELKQYVDSQNALVVDLIDKQIRSLITYIDKSNDASIKAFEKVCEILESRK